MVLGEKTTSRRDHLIVQANQRGLAHIRSGESYRRKGRAQQYKALREGPWKLIVNATAGSPEGLYELGTDPQEQENLIANPDSAGRAAVMMQRYDEILNSQRSTPTYAP
jgi:hypothetical protein